MKRLITVCATFSLSFASVARAQDIPAEYQQVLSALARQGDYKANVLRVNIPRNDVSVTVANVKTPTPFGFGGWVAMTKGTGGMDVMMGDLVLTEDEVNPVMSALLDNGIDVTAVHNHFLWEQPRIIYMHVHAHGKPADLARKVKPALDLIGRGASQPTAAPTALPAAPATTIDTAKLAQIVGTQGEQTGAVYKITIGRDDLKLTEMGAPINARMGLNTWAAFLGTNDDAAVAGDVAMLAHEIQPVLKALRKNGIDVVAIHHHMTGTQPTIYFLHYWGTGPAEKLAAAFKAAVSETGKAKASVASRGLREHAIYRGATPQAGLSAAALKGLGDDGLLAPVDKPAPIAANEVEAASYIFAIGCTLPANAVASGKAESWADVPEVSDGYAPAATRSGGTWST
jgi:hypothetical protein